ncbi:type II toxin-antitoxin system VapC family toxin [Prosthecobacter vanneervenii]|uniref:Putative nucleic acid-binding protein n=1 Tax=Prosthecobacter vanneervenii TaxID=48466 RepID=A0A7W7YFJ7_9BACT|nr:type II toxin-antitoxin system VapC family toxin [Prosthecobacter vanneervenii]MBB5035251.1 putative nucleic acid-binding protein [Prosthecobacter vanneervenii]
MMTLVADANAALGTVLPGHDERISEVFLHHLSSGDAVFVPSLWLLETLNVLLVRERRKKLDASERDQAISCLHGYPVRVDEESSAHMAKIQTLATKHSLSAYDAAYLELTLRLQCPLLSSDGPLCAAAQAEGVPLL